MKYILYSTAYGLAAYYLIGFVKGGWYLGIFDGFFEEVELLVIFLGGVTQTLVAVILFGIPSNWISEYLRNRNYRSFRNTHVTNICLAALVAALHAFSLLEEGNMVVEFLSMWVFLGPIAIILGLQENHIKENQQRAGPSWY